MPEPRDHMQHRGALETLLRHIPGFRGYLEKEYRRDSDALERTWLADRLQQSKRSLDTVSSVLANAGHLESLPQIDHLRAKLDRVIARIRGAWQGYSGIFDLVKINEASLDRLYEHDVGMMNRVDEFATTVERLAGAPPRGPSADPTGGPPPLPNMAGTTAPAASVAPTSPPDPQTAIPQLDTLLDAIDQDCDSRTEILKGLA